MPGPAAYTEDLIKGFEEGEFETVSALDHKFHYGKDLALSEHNTQTY